MRCAGCRADLEAGDRFIRAAPSEFMASDVADGLDGLVAELLGGVGGEVAYCEECTQEGGHWQLETFHGDEAA